MYERGKSFRRCGFKISNSYDSTNCIRFLGYNLSPAEGHPFAHYTTKDRIKKRNRPQRTAFISDF